MLPTCPSRGLSLFVRRFISWPGRRDAQSLQVSIIKKRKQARALKKLKSHAAPLGERSIVHIPVQLSSTQPCLAVSLLPTPLVRRLFGHPFSFFETVAAASVRRREGGKRHRAGEEKQKIKIKIKRHLPLRGLQKSRIFLPFLLSSFFSSLHFSSPLPTCLSGQFLRRSFAWRKRLTFFSLPHVAGLVKNAMFFILHAHMHMCHDCGGPRKQGIEYKTHMIFCHVLFFMSFACYK